ncbi:MAG: L-2-hydroxyglutarate oxidase [Saprospiraceae bacterium]|nr:L-2-hydroxyglutarate oxidase [Saprospiraceae bacterium]
MYDIAIIGGGIVGLSVAFQMLAEDPSLKICVLEKEDEIAKHQSSHNSGVIHSGIYYQPGSYRAKNCRQGYRQLLEFCERYDIPHEICGKLIVATSEDEVPALMSILEKGKANGLEKLELINTSRAKEIEPHVKCTSAILVPQAGITDFKVVALKYAELFKDMGGEIHLGACVIEIVEGEGEVQIKTKSQVIAARRFISCAGLYADKLARMTKKDLAIQILPFRGEYFELLKDKEYLVNHLIYPVPNVNFPFLGVHFTRMIGGGIEAGPNAVLAFRREGYHHSQIAVGEFIETISYAGFQKLARKYWRTGWMEMKRSYSKSYFVSALQKLIPEINPNDVTRGRSGVRAIACDRSGNLIDDFLILESLRGLHVVNAPSPAATASLAIGKEIIERLKKI